MLSQYLHMYLGRLDIHISNGRCEILENDRTQAKNKFFVAVVACLLLEPELILPLEVLLCVTVSIASTSPTWKWHRTAEDLNLLCPALCRSTVGCPSEIWWTRSEEHTCQGNKCSPQPTPMTRVVCRPPQLGPPWTFLVKDPLDSGK